MEIAGKVFIVTGGASGLGEGTARMLTAKGATVVIADMQVEKGEAVAKEIGGAFVRCDVSNEADAQAVVDKYTVRTETDAKIPVVAPPPGSDVYLIARLWSFWPIIEFEKGKTYRLHLTSLDYNHGFSLQPANINIQIVPGFEHVVTVTPNQSGTYSVVCNEYCGINHHTMVGRVYVK